VGRFLLSSGVVLHYLHLRRNRLFQVKYEIRVVSVEHEPFVYFSYSHHTIVPIQKVLRQFVQM
jgi:hypothetical protein